jgi:nucleotide-binding universal stress UspA family protein
VRRRPRGRIGFGKAQGKEEDVSGVVMGSHNPSGLLEKFFGSSIAEAVVNKSKRPVLVVKH